MGRLAADLALPAEPMHQTHAHGSHSHTRPTRIKRSDQHIALSVLPATLTDVRGRRNRPEINALTKQQSGIAESQHALIGDLMKQAIYVS
jgi:hypothetical protein